MIRRDKGRQHLGRGAQAAPFAGGQHVDARGLLLQLLAGGADGHRDGSGHAVGALRQELGRRLQGHMAEGMRGPGSQAGDTPHPRTCEVRLDRNADQHILQAFAAERAGLEYAVCPYDIRHLWITTMLDKQVEISAIAHLAGTSVRMIIKTTTRRMPQKRKSRRAAAEARGGEGSAVGAG